ncbi:MAG: J domain-containing protein [Bacillota bacterium]
MEGWPFRRRKREKQKIENYYKILGTRSNAGPDKIKEKYIEKVREFPPETHSEEFQAVRRAYETLRDPVKRREYDMMYKYGGKLEKLFEDIMESMFTGNHQKAKKLLLQVNTMDQNILQVYLLLGQIAVFEDKLDEFHEYMETAMNLADQEETKEHVVIVRINMLLENSYEQKAYEDLQQYGEYIKDPISCRNMRMTVLRELKRYHELWMEIQERLPSAEIQNAEDIPIFIEWLDTALELGKWSEISRIQTRIRKFIKALDDEDDRDMLLNNYTWYLDAYMEAARYREAEIYIDLICYLNPGDEIYKEKKKELRHLAMLEKELDRMAKDMEMFPLIHIRSMDQFLCTYASQGAYDEFYSSLPHDMIESMEEEDEDIAFGIVRLKKKYPGIYKEFKDEWEEIFKKSTAGLNREARRRLR